MQSIHKNGDVSECLWLIDASKWVITCSLVISVLILLTFDYLDMPQV